ncbi:putative aarF domain-containing protein kinase 1 [Rhizophlyctis rosea]|nr:putative aarF domain-containing protein kinase 1 [Rhizophlyctis rosea]
MGIDYKWSLWRGPEEIGEEEYEKIKSECHARNAKRLLKLCETNGGIYLKLGQHIAAMVYLLPPEYTSAFSILFDRCPKTPLEDIEELFRTDLNASLSDFFSHFDPEPLGIASLAQVHRATLPTGAEVAVKIQHPYLDEYTPVDIATASRMVEFAKKTFPEFQLEWLAEEMRKSLPQELDFEHEAANAERVRRNFKGFSTLHIPDVHWAKRRILVMEYIRGSRIADAQYLKQHNISPYEVSEEMTKAFSEMIFLHGFVHCDPHPGNILIRARPAKWRFFPWAKKHNFEICLLDHGLYRTLSDSFRLDYARLWNALIAGDEPGIEHYSYRLFTQAERVSEGGIDHHRLFASMLTGRTWDVISKSSGKDLTSARNVKELQTMQTNATSGRFFIAIVDVLAKLPRELLLLLKTNDLLRKVDDDLGVSSGATDHMLRMLATMGWYCALAIRRQTVKMLREERSKGLESGDIVVPLPVWVDGRFWESLWEYWGTGVKLRVLNLVVLGKGVYNWWFGKGEVERQMDQMAEALSAVHNM